MILVKVSSTESYEEITKTIKAGITFLGSGKFQTTNSVFNSIYDFKAHIIGGKASDAAKVVDGIDAVFDIIKRGADYADGNPGFPVNYRATYLRTNEPVLGGKTISYKELITEEWDNGEDDFAIRFVGIELNKLDNNIESIRNPKIRIVLRQWHDGASSYDTLLDYEQIYNKTFKSGDWIEITQSETVYIHPVNNTKTYASVELWTENGERIFWIYYTWEIEHICNRFSYSKLPSNPNFGASTSKLYTPDNTEW